LSGNWICDLEGHIYIYEKKIDVRQTKTHGKHTSLSCVTQGKGYMKQLMLSITYRKNFEFKFKFDHHFDFKPNRILLNSMKHI
jgi:hypothetical protein